MLFSPEFISLPIDWNTFLYGTSLTAGAIGLASVFTHEHPAEEIDENVLKGRIAELEKSSARTLEQNAELADLYSAWATARYDDGEELDEIVQWFGKAETVLQGTLAQGDDIELRRQLGNVYLNWAVALNDYDDLRQAIGVYQKAIDTLKPLGDSGDGEAKYDIAGIKLNLGFIYHELGELGKAKTHLDESFLAYRAVEKIGAMFDTRYYMAKVSVQQGRVLHDLAEPLDSIVDAYNRAMRLYVEVIEDEKRTELERDLAAVLLDRCMAVYEDCLESEFASEEERDKKISEVSLDICRGVELLEKQYKEGNAEARFDLFHSLVLQGKVLCDISQFAEAQKTLDRAIDEFADLCDEEGDIFLMQMAMAYASRAVAQMGLGKKDLSRQDCQKGSEMINKLLQSDSNDEEILELKQQFQLLLDQLK